MNKKTTEHAAKVLKKIKSELTEGVIKECSIPTLCNTETCEKTGFAVVLTLSTKFDYTNTVLDNWKERLSADDYLLRVQHNQLIVRFNVRF